MQVEVLGTAQDGGVPHLDCECPRCEAARADPDRRRYAASLVVRAGGSPSDGGERILVDATPDLRWQLATLPDRVVLTHAHHGHVGGLPQFDREVAAAGGLHVHCTPGLADILRSNEPFRSLVDATFWSADERAGYESVPHSTGRAVMETFEDSETEVYLTHLNHTNPLLDGESVEREKVQEAGLEVAERGQTFALE